MKQKAPKVVEVRRDELDEIFQQAQVRILKASEIELLRSICVCYFFLIEQLRQAKTSIQRLKKMLFGAPTEKADQLFPENSASAAATGQAPGETAKEANEKKRPRGHGRNAADAYTGAQRIRVPLESLEAGDACPECGKGTLYETPTPAVVVRIVGQAPVGATVFELERFRCNLCGKVFTADLPEEAGQEKYDHTATAVIALLKYGTGLPFNRFERLQGSLGVPLPASTQWDLVHAQAKIIQPVLDELIRQAAQGDVIHNDDTTSKILEFMGKRARKAAAAAASAEKSSEPAESAESCDDQPSSGDEQDSRRTGIFTSGIISRCCGYVIALFFTGRQHCGENLRDVLLRRAKELLPPIQMCDGLSRNLPAKLETILANCLSHGRRKFVDVVDHFPSQCQYVIEALKVIYENDAEARKEKMSPVERLAYHQLHSRPTMDALHKWLQSQFDDRLVEPNSGLGQAITYMLNRWDQLTLFLREAGAPLDNNIVERALKKAILHRKNSLFFKTQTGADVSDLYMSLIYTCELNGVNPLDYLVELRRHAEALAAAPAEWMPWNYREAVKRAATAKAPSAA
jgi:transposase